MLDLLHAPKASLSMLVFSLPDLQNATLCEKTLKQLRTQLDSFAVHASTSPLLLVGTRKDEAIQNTGGAPEVRTLRGLSDQLREALTEARLAQHVPLSRAGQ